MPIPQQARLTLSTYRPQNVDDHEANLRAIDRAHSFLPFFEETVWNKLYNAPSVGWVPTAAGFKELGNFWWTKQYDWTRILFMADIKMLCSPFTGQFHFEARFSVSPSAPVTRSHTICGSNIGTVARSMTGRLFDSTLYPGPSLRNGRWYVSFGVVCDGVAGASVATIGNYESCYFSLQEIARNTR